MISKKIRAYKLANSNAKAKEIAEVLGIRVNYVYQALRFKSVKAKKDKPTEVTNPTDGQKIIRDEITRLNKEKETLQMFYDVAEDRNTELDEENHQLKMDIIGYRAVISYLQGQIDGITV